MHRAPRQRFSLASVHSLRHLMNNNGALKHKCHYGDTVQLPRTIIGWIALIKRGGNSSESNKRQLYKECVWSCDARTQVRENTMTTMERMELLQASSTFPFQTAVRSSIFFTDLLVFFTLTLSCPRTNSSLAWSVNTSRNLAACLVSHVPVRSVYKCCSSLSESCLGPRKQLLQFALIEPKNTDVNGISKNQ